MTLERGLRSQVEHGGQVLQRRGVLRLLLAFCLLPVLFLGLLALCLATLMALGLLAALVLLPGAELVWLPSNGMDWKPLLSVLALLSIVLAALVPVQRLFAAADKLRQRDHARIRGASAG